MTYLTANLASKGYIVAAIDHTDSVFGALKGFESTLLNRSSDQLFTIESLDQLDHQARSFFHQLSGS
jgi:predicted dienelactone hydrolase